MPLVIDWSGGTLLLKEGDSALVGRDANVDVPIPNNRISRHHLRITYGPSGWLAEDLGSSNGSFIAGEPLHEHALEGNMEISLGSREGPKLMISVVETGGAKEFDSESTTFTKREDLAAIHTSAVPINKRISLKPRTRIGRDQGNDVVFDDDLMVSRFHAEVVSNPAGGFDVIDLKSANGTFVNGQPVKRASLNVGDLLTIGSTVMTYARGSLEPLDNEGGFSFTARGIGLVIGGKRLLSKVSFDLKPKSLTAVVGPSGSGKSTLLSVLSGQRMPTNGSVEFAGRNLHASYEELRNRIGLVPQADLLHTNLKTQRALEYGAALRLPRDTTPAERSHRVQTVMEDLGLTKRADLRIDKLSGGQRKRASVALELITDPELLFLDEPTSGLDPGLDRQVMKMLRALADSGRTVLIVTHSTANLDVCDDIVVMAAGGHLAYFGSPYSVMDSFKAKDWADVFERLEEEDFSSRGDTTEQTMAAGLSKPVEFAQRRQQGWFYQFGQLAKRYVEVIASDKPYVGLTVALPFILGLVAQLTGSDLGIGPGAEEDFFLNPEVRSTLLIVVLAAVFMGSATAVQELVKERVIYERERSTGLSPSAYLLSKFMVLAVISGLQGTVFIAIALVGRPLPDEDLVNIGSMLSILSAVVLLSILAVAIGLFLSSIANSTEVTMPFLVVATMAQVVFSGAVPLVSMTILDIAKWLNPSYWAMSALGAMTDLNSLSGLDAETEIAEWSFEYENYSNGLLGIVLFAFLFLAVTLASLKSRERKA
jgi:ABC-type multidrug transport system ATPase subunit/pSer/pThr/pTyr-binding forkhead associated (FHA) protein